MAFMPQAASRCNAFDNPANLPLFAYLERQPDLPLVREPAGLTHGGRAIWRRKRCSTALANTIAALAGIGQEFDHAR